MVSFPTKITNKEQAIKFVDEIDTFLIDCDGNISLTFNNSCNIQLGVIWHTEHVLDGVIDTLSLLKKMVFCILDINVYIHSEFRAKESYLSLITVSNHVIHMQRDLLN